ncbi:hypothetical protein BX600DRAFT_437216 [Xylariales sp. PMI_506]|nr:hypothetical protein BX600DRAFT_437216 [Xylariales sp. PMI_506]
MISSRIRMLVRSVAVLRLLTSSVQAQSTATDATSNIYLDNGDYIANASNVVQISWPALEAGFSSPNETDSASFDGFDWTKPYPGTPLAGFAAHLRIADDVAWPDTVGDNQTTAASAITYSVPSALMGADGVPLSPDPSWYICQHYFVSTWPDPTLAIDHSCGFLTSQCLADLRSNLTEFWGLRGNPTIPCSGMVFDTVPATCQGALGLVTADVLGWDASYFGDSATAEILAVDQVSQYSWMIGTGYVDKYNQTAYYEASNRTYVLATVFGYSSAGNTTGVQPPTAELACLRPEWKAPLVSTSTSITLANTGTGTPTPTLSVSSTTTSASASSTTGSTVTSTSATPTQTYACVNGTTAEGISGNFLGLCSYSCNFNHCPEGVCICTQSASVPLPTPSLTGQAGCPIAAEASDPDDSYYADLCEFTCSHGYCPPGACEYC